MKKVTKDIFSWAMAACLALQGLTVMGAPVEAKGNVETKGAVGDTAVVKQSDLETEGKKLLTEDELEAALSENGISEGTRASVHDPSIVLTKDEEGKDVYYAFGTHMAVAKTYDLKNWQQVSKKEYDENSNLFGVVSGNDVRVVSYDDAFEESAYKGKVKTVINGVEKEVDFGTYNGEAWHTAIGNDTVAGNLWAPDVIYNETMNKWCMYLSLNGGSNQTNSVIVLLTADDIEGPYVYQGPVVYSGFYRSEDALSYKNTDLELVYGELSEKPAKYNKSNRQQWGNVWPHAIDPCVFYDEEGTLRMIYGSWSGGIYEFVLDETTGLRDYTVTYEDKGSGNDIVSDRYFGKHIAGGWYVSGEGAYIEYIDGKYYLFVTNGDLGADGNYHMRVFSSDNPEGPFVDSNGVSAIYEEFQINYNSDYGDVYGGTDLGAKGSTRGSRLMTNYRWNFMDAGEISQGHNSAIVTEDGAFVIYHSRFDDGRWWHEIRVHELFTVGDGMLVAAPMEYDPAIEDKEAYTSDDVAALYDVMFQKYDTNLHWSGGSTANGGSLKDPDNMECETPDEMKFTSDGKIMSGGSEVGSFKISDNQKNATVTINELIGDEHLVGEYSCIVVEQNAGGKQATCFTGMNAKTGISIWACANTDSDERAVALTVKNMENKLPYRTLSSLTLPTQGISGATISWKSNAPEILSNEGKIGTVTQDTQVTLTETIERGNCYYERTHKVIVATTDISKGGMSIELPSADYISEIDNPFYKEPLNQLYISYTMTLGENASLDGLGGLFSFYKSGADANTKVGHVSLHSAPYISYRSQNEAYMEVNKPADNRQTLEKGKAYNCEILIDRETDKIRISLDGEEISLDGKIAATADVTAKDVLYYIESECDKFSWGVGNGKTADGTTQACTLENVVISNEAPAEISLTDVYKTGSAAVPTVFDNPFAGEEIKLLNMEYTVKYADAEIAENAGLLAFYESEADGRVSFHAKPYICYNDAAGSWMDLKTTRSYHTGGSTYKFKFVITEDGIELYINDRKSGSPKLEGGSGANYEDMLSFIAQCDKLSMGVDGSNSYWAAADAELSDVHFWINNVSKVVPPYVVVADNQGDDSGDDKEEPSTPSTPSTPTPGGSTVKPTPNPGGSTVTPTQPKVTVKKASVKSVKNKKSKQMTVTWKKVSGASGYELQYSTTKKFTKSKTKTVKVKKGTTTSKTIKKLKKGKKYYVRVRAYKTVKGKKYYGKYSAIKSVKIKK